LARGYQFLNGLQDHFPDWFYELAHSVLNFHFEEIEKVKVRIEKRILGRVRVFLLCVKSF